MLNEKKMGVIKKNVNILKIFTHKPDIKGWKGALKYILKRVLFIFFASSIFMTILYRFVPVPVTPLMLIRNMEQLSDGKELRLKKQWVPIEKISPEMVNAVVASEDNLFMSHWGFDFDAISKAKKMNEKGKKVYGASTISQQTAKNVFLWPSRTWVRKGLECYFTVLIEIFWPKKRIMEVYLNVAETGDGIYGVEAASRHYYKKSADKLTQEQAALIAASLPAPRRYNPANPTSYIRSRQKRIIRLMKQIGPVKLEKKEKETKQKGKSTNTGQKAKGKAKSNTKNTERKAKE